jgi:c-di-GMP-related signal transduction protein
VIDALTDRPMASVVSSLPFPPEMRDALVNRTGSGRLLDCVVAMEEGEFRRARALAASAPEHYLDALAWSNETAKHLLDSEAVRA